MIGLRIEQFHTPYDPLNPGTTNVNAMPETYWNEALRRDPGDVRVNTVLGIDAIKGGRYAEAEKYLLVQPNWIEGTIRLTTSHVNT